jgi:hypothetical protein
MFIDGVELFLQQDINSLLQLNDIILLLLLFADHMVDLGDSPKQIYKSLNLFSPYSDIWSLNI